MYNNQNIPTDMRRGLGSLRPVRYAEGGDVDAAKEKIRASLQAGRLPTVKTVMDATGLDFNTVGTMIGDTRATQRMGVKTTGSPYKIDLARVAESDVFEEDPAAALRGVTRALVEYDAAQSGAPAGGGRGEVVGSAGPITLRGDRLAGGDPYLRAYITTPGGRTLTQTGLTGELLQRDLQRFGASLSQDQLNELRQMVGGFYGDVGAGTAVRDRGQQLRQVLDLASPMDYSLPAMADIVSTRQTLPASQTTTPAGNLTAATPAANLTASEILMSPLTDYYSNLYSSPHFSYYGMPYMFESVYNPEGSTE